MKRGLALVYTVVTVVFFLAVAAVLLVRLGSVRERNLTEAQERFRLVQTEILDLASEADIPISRVVQRAFRSTSPPVDRVVAFAAYGLQENVEYLWARDRRLLDETGQEVPRFTYDRVTQARLSGSVRLPDESSLILEGVYTVLDRRDIFALLRDALIAVLAFALLAVILAVITLLRPAPRSAGGPHPVGPEAPEPEPDAAPRRPAGEKRRAATEAPPVPRPTAEGDTEGIDAGLFSPQSGLSPEAHLEKRLSLELERAAANDQDLSICFIEYPKLDRGSDTYREVASALVGFFGFEDLIFEYGRRSFCILFPNMNLHEAIRLVEDFQRRSAGPAGESSDARVPRSAGRPAFGLSSRNGRLVEGGRLMREARQALAKAREIPGRVMGFSPDAQRYRRYLSETGA
jgi:GGDEF domain-containing protein